MSPSGNNKEEERYKKEHEDSFNFHAQLEQDENQRYTNLRNEWEDRRIRFHVLKQENAIKTFQERIDSSEFVNPEARVRLFKRMKKNQTEVHKKRLAELKVLDNTDTNNLTVKKVEQIESKLESIDDAAQEEYDKIAVELTESINRSNNEMDTALERLRRFLHANSAKIPEDTTYDQIVDEQALPFVERRKLEAKEIYVNSLKYLEESDERMNETCKNIIEFLKSLATKYDKGKEELKATDFQFNVKLAQCADTNYDSIDDQEENLNKNIDQMKKAIHHVELNQKLNE